MGFGKTSKVPGQPAEKQGDGPADTAAASDPVVAIGKDGMERPLSGGSYIRDAEGKLQRREA